MDQPTYKVKIHHHGLKRQGSNIDQCVRTDLKVKVNMVYDCGFDGINGKIQFCTYLLSKTKHCAIFSSTLQKFNQPNLFLKFYC